MGQIKNKLIYFLHDGALERASSKYFKGRLIDIGCGTKPYKDMLAGRVTEHVGADHAESMHDRSNVDLDATAYQIPSPDASFDSALCSAVLEHLEEPEAALRECWRVLKPGAFAIYTVPFMWQIHEEPRDFFRYTRFGIQYLFKKAGFEIVEINALSGFWGTFGEAFVYYMYRFNRGPLRWIPIIPALALLIQGAVYVADSFEKTEEWTWLYLVVVRKPVNVA